MATATSESPRSLRVDHGVANGVGRRAPVLPGIALTIMVGMPFLRTFFGLPAAAYVAPIALLLLSAALRMTAGGLRVPKEVLALLLVSVAFLSWMMASSIWPSTGADAGDDLFHLTSLLVVVLATGAAFDQASSDRAIDVLIAGSLIAAGYVFWTYIQAGSLRGWGLFSGDYLTVAQFVGIGAVMASLRAMTARAKGLRVAAAIVLMAGLALSLARGALISALLVVAAGGIYVALQSRRGAWSVGSWIAVQLGRARRFLILAAGVGIVILGAFQVERTRLRLLRLVLDGELLGGPRARLWERAVTSIGDAPVLGHGLGSSGLMSGAGEGDYPHNWLLQVWLDGGVVAAILCLATLALAPGAVARLGRGARAARKAVWLPLLGAYLFLLLEFAKSSDFYAARGLFALAVLVVYASRRGSEGLPTRSGPRRDRHGRELPDEPGRTPAMP